MSNFPLLHDPDKQADTDAWYCRIPVIGWMIGGSRQYANERRLVRQAIDRGPVPREAWQNKPYDSEIREKVSKIAIAHAYPNGSEFHPDDPIELMLVLRYGDLNECEMMMDIEDAFGIKFTDELVKHLIEDKVTFLQFIQYLQDAQQGAQPDAFGAG